MDLSANVVRARYRSGEITPVDVLEAALAQIARVNPVLNAMAAVDEPRARAAAEASARRWAAQRPLSPLDGIPVTVKDSVRTVGLPWRHGCAAHADLPVSTSDAPPAARLKEAGAVIVGTTTMPDFGMLAAGVSSQYGITRNPWDPGRSPGGSSAGSGAALAAGIGHGSVGSDIAGSVRLPAAQCGLVALKPTQGRVPHLAPSTVRSAGPMARTTDELIDLYRVLSRPDPRDHFSLPPEADDVLEQPFDARGLRIGVLTDLGYGLSPTAEVLAPVSTAAAVLEAAGSVLVELPPPFDHDPYPPLDRLFQVRARTEWESLPEPGRGLVLPAVADCAAQAAGYSAAQFARDTEAVLTAQETLRLALADVDLVLTPVLPVASFPAEDVGVDPAVPLGHCGFTAWFNQTGQPASALCFGLDDAGCPLGIQIAGRRFDDQWVLRATRWLEERRPFAMAWPVTMQAEAAR